MAVRSVSCGECCSGEACRTRRAVLGKHNAQASFTQQRPTPSRVGPRLRSSANSVSQRGCPDDLLTSSLFFRPTPANKFSVWAMWCRSASVSTLRFAWSMQRQASCAGHRGEVRVRRPPFLCRLPFFVIATGHYLSHPKGPAQDLRHVPGAPSGSHTPVHECDAAPNVEYKRAFILRSPGILSEPNATRRSHDYADCPGVLWGGWFEINPAKVKIGQMNS